jgi:hypothetical protein
MMGMVRILTTNVPEPLRHLIALAERRGIADDLDRERALACASAADIAALKAAVAANEEELEQWLAGEASYGPVFSDEYIASTAMVMAADFA